jgi:AcrR family transcriptional regulator
MRRQTRDEGDGFGPVVETQLGARALAKKRINDEILRVSLRLFRQHGYDAVSTQTIADAAGITQRTLFRYFPQKAHILYKNEHDYVVCFEEFLDGAMTAGLEPMEAIRSAFQSLASRLDANRAYQSLVYAIKQGSDELKAIERGQQTYIDRLVAFALDGHKAYVARHQKNAKPSLTSRIHAALIFAAIRPMYRAWLTGELKGPLLPYALAGWAVLPPVLDASRTFAADSVAAYARVDAATKRARDT